VALSCFLLQYIRSRWIAKDRLSADMKNEVDWPMIGSVVMRELPRNMKRFISKWTTKQIAVGIKSKAKCHRCKYLQGKTTLYVLKCWDKTAIAEWKKLVMHCHLIHSIANRYFA